MYHEKDNVLITKEHTWKSAQILTNLYQQWK